MMASERTVRREVTQETQETVAPAGNTVVQPAQPTHTERVVEERVTETVPVAPAVPATPGTTNVNVNTDPASGNVNINTPDGTQVNVNT